jgi:hypothetical protein
MGGYLAGRLRTKWADLHTDEVYFRDTAHGFLAWAVASLATAALLSSVIASILGTGVQAGAALADGVAGTAQGKDGGPMGYFVDSLFRHDAVAAAPATGTAGAAGSATATDNTERTSARDTAEVGRIFLNVSRAEPLPAEDIRYVGQIVAQRTGLSQQSAEKRVADIYAQAQAKARDAEMAARSAADKARKASAYSALWLFISLLVGAFCASLAATFGGRRRDA